MSSGGATGAANVAFAKWPSDDVLSIRWPPIEEQEMAEFSIPKPGTICWRELATRDLAKAEDFYSQMFGWQLEQSKITPMTYSEIHIDGAACGGMMPIDEGWGEDPPPSHWTPYIAVADADETAAKVKANGGTMRQEPFDAPGVGRIGLCTDPCGANFAIIQFAAPA